MSTAPATLRVPGDKSITHRALLLAALARGRSRVRGALVSLDTRSTASTLRALGVGVPDLGAGDVVIGGSGLHAFRSPADALDCGNSGTSARHLLGLMAGCGFRCVVTGDASLRSRPMRRVTAPLAEAGARFRELAAPDRLPIEVHGTELSPIVHDAPQASAQVKSSLLMAALTGATIARLSEPLLSRDHTERMLSAMGARLTRTAGERPGVSLDETDHLDPIDITVPGDVSTAAFFMAHALLAGVPLIIEDVGLNPTRTGFLDVITRMGADLRVLDRRIDGGEPVGSIHVAGGSLTGISVGAADIPGMIDEVPALAVLGARADGVTRITGAGELRVKESDRIATLAANLRAIGVAVEELSDGLVIEGTARRLAGPVASHGDHRIAMAFGVLSAVPDTDIRIDDPAIAAVSDPGFWDRLGTLRGVSP